MILNTHMDVYKSSYINSDITNGGIMSNVISPSNTYGNVFADINDTERRDGSTVYRKVFWKINNPDNTALTNAAVYMSKYTPGGDYVVMFKGTHTDIQEDITGTERIYGAAPLETSVMTGSTVFSVLPENINEMQTMFSTGDDIVISDGIVTEKHLNVTCTIVSNSVAVTLDVGDEIVNNFDVNSAIVSSLCPINDIVATVDPAIVESVSGSYDDTTHRIEHSNKGALEQTWTFTFTNSTQFTCSGNTRGYVGTGSIGVDFAPVNTNMNAIYFMLRAAGWTGEWQEGDKLIVTTHPASQGIWFKRVVPAGVSSSPNKFEHMLVGQAAQ